MIKNLKSVIAKNLAQENSCILTKIYDFSNELSITVTEEYGEDLDIDLTKEQVTQLKSILIDATNALDNDNKYEWHKFGNIKGTNQDNEDLTIFVYIHYDCIVLGISLLDYLIIENRRHGVKIVLNRKKISEFKDVLDTALKMLK